MADDDLKPKPAAKSGKVSRAMRDMPKSGTGPEIRIRKILLKPDLDTVSNSQCRAGGDGT